jgi:hypothetical protein
MVTATRPHHSTPLAQPPAAPLPPTTMFTLRPGKSGSSRSASALTAWRASSRVVYTTNPNLRGAEEGMGQGGCGGRQAGRQKQCWWGRGQWQVPAVRCCCPAPVTAPARAHHNHNHRWTPHTKRPPCPPLLSSSIRFSIIIHPALTPCCCSPSVAAVGVPGQPQLKDLASLAHKLPDLSLRGVHGDVGDIDLCNQPPAGHIDRQHMTDRQHNRPHNRPHMTDSTAHRGADKQ